MNSIRQHSNRLRMISCLVLSAVFMLSSPAHALDASRQVQQALYSLGLQRYFTPVEPLLARELERYSGQGKSFSGHRSVIMEELAAPRLQAAVEAYLLEHYDPDLYQQVIAALSREEIVPLVQSCHGQALQDYGPQLQAYEQQLALQPAKAKRRNLARQIDLAARSSTMAGQLHNTVDQLLYSLADRPGGTVRWEEVEAERIAVLQEAMQTWYLYCGRFFPDRLLQEMVDSYQLDAVQGLLDQYQAAVAATLAGVADSLGGQGISGRGGE